jgi:hypothetical protein
MSLNHKFKQAEKILGQLSAPDARRVATMCAAIKAAEIKLVRAARANIRRCYANCVGLCCNNAQLDAIFGMGDFVYLLTVVPTMRDRIAGCLQDEVILFTSDCIFLRNGKGPCIFPFHSRPEVCITTFCENDWSIRQEISAVKKKFMKLNGYLSWYQTTAFLRYGRLLLGKCLS